ncbi:MAG: lysylphosphatidylglycerol synthase transmembrane domain-containing protein [Nocardioidaceae bacterium]
MRRGGLAITGYVLRWVRLAVGAGILVVIVGRLGTGPFLDAVRAVDAWALGAGLGITALTTVCCAWRWRLVANALGVAVRPRTAVAAYYRSQFLNATLPGGVLGDVHRGVRHGRGVHAVGRCLRAVVWERSLGQLVQLGLTAVVVLALPSPFRSSVVAAVAAGVLVALGCLALLCGARRPASTRPVLRTLVADMDAIVRVPRTWSAIVLASGLAVAGHAAIFLVAVRTAGVTVSAGSVLPLSLLVLLASAVPVNVAGWGPREGAAVWAFGAVGLSAAQGVTVAVVYGVMALFATFPGAVVLLAEWRRQDVDENGARRRTARTLKGALHG